jgi:hypothetical protein
VITAAGGRSWGELVEIKRVAAGSACGVLATMVMSGWMLVGQVVSRHGEQPPIRLVRGLAGRAGIPTKRRGLATVAATGAAHLGFGLGAGALYGAIVHRSSVPHGVAFGYWCVGRVLRRLDSGAAAHATAPQRPSWARVDNPQRSRCLRRGPGSCPGQLRRRPQRRGARPARCRRWVRSHLPLTTGVRPNLGTHSPSGCMRRRRPACPGAIPAANREHAGIVAPLTEAEFPDLQPLVPGSERADQRDSAGRGATF